jgi:hypothetical protein
MANRNEQGFGLVAQELLAQRQRLLVKANTKSMRVMQLLYFMVDVLLLLLVTLLMVKLQLRLYLVS